MAPDSNVFSQGRALRDFNRTIPLNENDPTLAQTASKLITHDACDISRWSEHLKWIYVRFRLVDPFA